MNWLSMLPDEDKRQIVKELASRLSAEPILASTFESAVDKVLRRYNFSKITGENSLKHLTTADQPLIDLLNVCKFCCEELEKHNHLAKIYLPMKKAADAVAKLYSVKL